MRRILPLVAVFALGLAIGHFVRERPAEAKATPSAAISEDSMIEVNYPTDPDRAIRHLQVVQTKTGGQKLDSSTAAPPTNPRKTWVITFGKYGEPGWRSVVAVAP